MAASSKHLAITLCLLGLMAGSACAAPESLNNQDFVHGVPNRRLKLPPMYSIYHPAPAPPSANYAEPASPVPEEQYDAPPTASPPSAMENESTTPQKPDPDAPPTVNDMCGENQCVGMYINKDTYFIIKYA